VLGRIDTVWAGGLVAQWPVSTAKWGDKARTSGSSLERVGSCWYCAFHRRGAASCLIQLNYWSYGNTRNSSPYMITLCNTIGMDLS